LPSQTTTMLPLSSVSNNNPLSLTNVQNMVQAGSIRKENSVSNLLGNLAKNHSISVKSVNNSPINMESRVSNSSLTISPASPYQSSFPTLQIKPEQQQVRNRTNSSGSYVQPAKRSRVDLNDSIEIVDEVDPEQMIFTCQDCKESFRHQIAINKHDCKKLDKSQCSVAVKTIAEKGILLLIYMIINLKQ
jgi:hypothetical protein